jgi:hypothetical protein
MGSETLIAIITGFWLWMLVDCYSNKQDRLTWFWIVLLLYFPGALIYFLNRNPQSLTHKRPNPLRRLQLKQELYKAKISVKYIGKSYQYLIIGNILLELGEFERAEFAYQKALSTEPKNPYALWGAASAAFYRDRFAVASRHLELLLKIDPKHLQGDASLLYAKALFSLGKSITKVYLQEDIHCWGHPESIIMLAKLEIKDGRIKIAKQLLQNLLIKLKNSPTYHARRYQNVSREAKGLLITISLPLLQAR